MPDSLYRKSGTINDSKGESEVVLQEICPSAANAISQMLLFIIPSLPVYHKMPNCEQNLDHDLCYRNFPRIRLRFR